MILADTSVWIDHLRDGNDHMEALLARVEIISHPAVIGELACGSIPERAKVLSLLRSLPHIMEAEHDEVMNVIESQKLMHSGVGWLDAHILTAARLSDVPLWTFDKRLSAAARALKISYSP